MKAQAGVFYGEGQPIKVEEIDVDDPKENEVMLKMVSSGLCHSDYHMVTGEFGPIPMPMIGGHEGAGIVEKVGPGVRNVAPGDHVLLSFLPACGQCQYCAMGQSQYCDSSATILEGKQLDGTHRARGRDGTGYGQFCLIGTFANYAVVPAMSCIKVHHDQPLDKICLMGCCIPTGFGSATKSAGTREGEVVVVFGIGGVGANALQGAASAGARAVIAVDPQPFKREMAEQLGATHTIDPTTEDVAARVMELTYNRGADRVVITIGNPTPEDYGKAFACTRKAGRLVCTSVAHSKYDSLPISPFELTLFAKQVVGNLFGDSTFREDIPRLLEMYSAGKLKIDELITKTYKLGDINQGYQDMLDGKNIRGVIIHEH
ncbi:MAG: NDMA-dependent alcohol dehydrogenase [Sandaracinaceae bacterium]